MDINIQIVCMIFSYLYGVLYYFLIIFNKYITANISLLLKIITNIIFSLNTVILYLIILYKLNYGVLHFYFFILIIIGFISGIHICKYIVNKKNKY